MITYNFIIRFKWSKCSKSLRQIYGNPFRHFGEFWSNLNREIHQRRTVHRIRGAHGYRNSERGHDDDDSASFFLCERVRAVSQNRKAVILKLKKQERNQNHSRKQKNIFVSTKFNQSSFYWILCDMTLRTN